MSTEYLGEGYSSFMPLNDPLNPASYRYHLLRGWGAAPYDDGRGCSGGWRLGVDWWWELGMAETKIRAGRGLVGDDYLGKGTRARIPRG